MGPNLPASLAADAINISAFENDPNADPTPYESSKNTTVLLVNGERSAVNDKTRRRLSKRNLYSKAHLGRVMACTQLVSSRSN